MSVSYCKFLFKPTENSCALAALLDPETAHEIYAESSWPDTFFTRMELRI